MKAMVCEMCGSQDLVKQDGMYVCQNCNTKYSVDDAKKLFVTIDNTEKVDNLYKIARQAIAEGNNENAAKYYDMIYMERPDDWEAAFYTVYCNAMQTTIGGISNASAKIALCIPNVMQLIHDYVQGDSEQKAAVQQVANKVASGGLSLGQAQLSHYKKFSTVDGARKEFEDTMTNIATTSFITGDVIENVFSDKNDFIVDIACELWNVGISASYDNMAKARYQGKIQRYKPSYHANISTSNSSGSSSGGCYVATAVYGSYNCPQVWTLRRYRDYALAKTWYGRAFINAYYTISPTLVKWFGTTTWFNRLFRPKLDRFVKQLNDAGFEDTPYEDTNW